MALRRVRSKHKPIHETVRSDEYLERFPDEYHVIDDEPLEGPVGQSRDESPSTRVPSYVDDPDYR